MNDTHHPDKQEFVPSEATVAIVTLTATQRTSP